MTRPNAFQDHLVKASAEMARLALDDISVTSRAEAASTIVRAGMAVEFLLRAIVANVSPTLLFMGRNQAKATAAMIRAHQSAHVEVEWLAAQTSSDTALVRSLAIQALPALDDFDSHIGAVLDNRNAVVHVYAVGMATLRPAVISLARVVAVALPRLDVKPKKFWGRERLALINALIDESLETVRAEVAVKIRDAQIRFAELAAQLAHGDMMAVTLLMESEGNALVPPNRVIFRRDCPACEYSAEMFVRVEDEVHDLDNIELAEWRNDVPTVALIPQLALAVQLQCPVCRLALSYAELEAVYPELADLTGYELQPRRGSFDEYNQRVWESLGDASFPTSGDTEDISTLRFS